ncbi:MAG: RNA polymerase sigma factor [Acidobacteriota bacterium]
MKEDRELIALCARGDEDAFTILYHRYKSRLLNYFYRLFGNRERAEELMQETFVRVWRAAPKFQGKEASFRTWLYAISHHLAASQLRKRRYLSLPLSKESEEQQLSERNAVPLEHQLIKQEEEEIVKRSILRLPSRQREVILLRHYEGLTYREISAVVGCPLGTAKTRFHHGIKKLHSILRIEFQNSA